MFLRRFILGFLIVGSLFSEERIPPDTVSFGMGAYDFQRARHRTWEFDAEYRIYPNWIRSPVFEVRPVFGIMMTALGSGFVWGGLDFDFLIGEHLVICPGFAPGYYWQGHGKNLGFPLEFRTRLELGWQFDDYRRAGVQFYHLSNAGLGSRNPGEESILFYYEIPVISGFPFFRR